MHVAAHRVLLVDNHDARRDSSTIISGSGSQNCEDLLCRSHWFTTSVAFGPVIGPVIGPVPGPSAAYGRSSRD